MKEFPQPIDLRQLRVYPLAQRRSLSSIEKILIDPASPAPQCGPQSAQALANSARKIQVARERNSSVILIFGAHLIKNGAQRIVIKLIEDGWITHLATNGAGTIHDW